MKEWAILKAITLWMDDDMHLGVVKVEDDVFGAYFQPVERTRNEKWELLLINNLWYTTYHGARQYFRSKTNPYCVTGKMKKVYFDEETRFIPFQLRPHVKEGEAETMEGRSYEKSVASK